MANHPSALKRHRQSEKRHRANRAAKSRLHTLTRQLLDAVAAGDKVLAATRLREVSAALAKAAAKGQIHRANASRRTSRLARRVASLEA